MNFVYVLILVGFMDGFVLTSVDGIFESEEECFWAMQDSIETMLIPGEEEIHPIGYDAVCIKTDDIYALGPLGLESELGLDRP